MHSVAPSAGLNPHSAFGLEADGVEPGSHVADLAVGGPAAAKHIEKQ